MACALCVTSTSFVTMTDRKCAFPDDRADAEFTANNRHCGTMLALRSVATFQQPSRNWNACIVPNGGRFVVLVWEGAGGARVCVALVVDRDGCIPLTLDFAAATIAERTSRRGRA